MKNTHQCVLSFSFSFALSLAVASVFPSRHGKLSEENIPVYFFLPSYLFVFYFLTRRRYTDFILAVKISARCCTAAAVLLPRLAPAPRGSSPIRHPPPGYGKIRQQLFSSFILYKTHNVNNNIFSDSKLMQNYCFPEPPPPPYHSRRTRFLNNIPPAHPRRKYIE